MHGHRCGKFQIEELSPCTPNNLLQCLEPLVRNILIHNHLIADLNVDKFHQTDTDNGVHRMQICAIFFAFYALLHHVYFVATACGWSSPLKPMNDGGKDWSI